MKKIILFLILIILISGCAEKIEEAAEEQSPEDILEGNIPEITNYPKLEQVFIDLYAGDGSEKYDRGLYAGGGFRKDEIEFMKVVLEIYKERPKLKEYPEEALVYLMSRSIGHQSFHDNEFFNQTLIPLAKEITGGTEDDLAAIKAIHEWVNDNIKYDEGSYPIHTPEKILKEKRGVCEHYSVMITALSKAAGIPARYISGSSHAWVEAYIDGDWISVSSTGTLDSDEDGIITYSDLVKLKHNRLLDVFIRSPYHPMHSRTDITFGYNNYIIQQMISEVDDMLEENYNLEAKDNLESTKNTFSLWEKEESTEERHRIGREAMEHILRAVAILKEDITGDEVQVAFLEDFPTVYRERSKEGKITSIFWREGVTQSADIKNPLFFWEDFEKSLVETNPKVLYVFDAAYETQTRVFFASHSPGIDLHMLRAIDELIKNEGLDTKLNLVLNEIGKEDLETIEFLKYEDIEPVITLIKVFEDNVIDFMWDFFGAINSVKDDVTETSFYLPPKFEERYDYYLTAAGTGPSIADPHPGYYLRFVMGVNTNISKLPLRLEVHYIPLVAEEDNFPKYTNLIIVDELGNVFKPDEENGKYYYSNCPSKFVNLDPGQNLIIEREGDFIKITETGKT